MSAILKCVLMRCSRYRPLRVVYVLLLKEVMVTGSSLVVIAEVSIKLSDSRNVVLAYIRVAWAPRPSLTDPSPNTEMPSHNVRDVAKDLSSFSV